VIELIGVPFDGYERPGNQHTQRLRGHTLLVYETRDVASRTAT
jgi:hypothetical protein